MGGLFSGLVLHGREEQNLGFDPPTCSPAPQAQRGDLTSLYGGQDVPGVG